MKPNILIVDDITANLHLFESILSKLDVSLITALSGIEALSKIKGQEIALALLDIRMPGMDGVELSRIIQNDQSRELVPIIFITAEEIDETKLEDRYELGVVDYILEPFSPKILKSKVKVFLELFRQKQQIREQHLLMEQSTEELLRLNKTLKESNEFNQSLLQTIPFGMDVVDEEGDILFLSKSLEDQFGKQAIGKKCWELYCDDQSQCGKCPLKEGINIGQTAIYERKDFMGGKTFQISHAGMIFNGKKAILEIFQDITLRRMAQKVLSESEANFRTFFETIVDPVAVVTPTGQILFTNNALNKKLGYSADELTGIDMLSLHPASERMDADEIFANMVQGRAETRSIPLVTREGLLIPVETRIWLGKWNGNDCIFFICKDLSNEKEAEERFERLFRNNPALMALSVMPEQTFLDVNNAFLQALGYTREEIIGKTTKELNVFPFPDEQEAVRNSLLLNGTFADVEIQVRRKDGTILTGLFSGEVITGKGRQYFLTVMIDISERKQMIESLHLSEKKFRQLVELAQEGIWSIDARSNTTYVNPHMARMLGYEVGEMLGRSLFFFLDEQGKELADMNIELRKKTIGERHDFEFIRKDGQRIYTTVAASPITDDNDNFLGTIALVSDITEKRSNEQKIMQNEKMLTSIIENLPFMLFVKDAKQLKYERFNKAGETLLGYSKDEIIGKTDYDFLPQQEAALLESADRNVLGSKLIEDIPEEKILTKYNGERVLSTKKIPIINSSGEVEFLLGISEDITSKKQIEDALRESEKMYRTLLNASPEGIVILDMEERIIEVSNITIEIFGAKNKNEFLGKDFFQFIPNKETEKLKDVLKKTLLDGLVQNVEFVLTKKNQSQFICELSTTLIQESDGGPKAYMAILRDISERKRIEHQLIRTERLVSLGEMASAMAHEINQPLLSISLGIDNLFLKIRQSNTVDEAYFHKKSEKIFEDILRIGRIIDHMRAFSRDHDDYILSSFDINESIKNAISMISEQFKHHGITMSVNLDQKVHPIIGNTYRFEQVILNLLTNAKDALDEKMKISGKDFEKSISIKTYYDADTNYVEIKDNGIGVNPNDIDRIMLPFFTTKEVGTGTGLGLSVSFGIIKELNGNIDFESSPGSGTLFRITLPLKNRKEKSNKESSIAKDHE